AKYLVPFGAFTGGLIAGDSWISRQVPVSQEARSKSISDYLTYSMIAGTGASYLWGHLRGNDHLEETGFLAGEAALNATAVAYALKEVTRRQRPFEGNGNGNFFQGGSSFPSEHSAIAWSVAGVIAHEYPGPLTKLAAYGAASAITLTRVTGKQHFPSDVVVGSALGWYFARQIYRAHHDPELGGSGWGSIYDSDETREGHRPSYMGSPYVPPDSWVYPAFERLIALGYINTAQLGIRPWARMECARLVSEAGDRIGEDDTNGTEADGLYEELLKEFQHEVDLQGGGDNAEMRVESAYTRINAIAGQPLSDGYHFGQTITNDFGRPEQEGFNNVTGLSMWAADGPFAVYVRGESQYSPSSPALPYTARQAIAQADFGLTFVPQPYPLPPGTPNPAFTRGRLLDAYVAMNLSDWQFSYGKQSLWWGPSQGGGMMLSDSAEPLTMFRVSRVTPSRIPLLGEMREEFFIGQYSGYQFMLTPSGLVGQWGQSLNPQQIVHGERLSFKPTANLEIGFSRTTDYGGPSYPLTFHTFLRSLFSTAITPPGAANKPGARRSGLDFSYRTHHLHGLTFYADGMTQHDNISPLIGPDVAAWLGGVYFPQLPKLPKMDLRIEGVQTDPPIGGNVGHGFFYYDQTWITGFQNAGQLMGNWVGREGQGVQAWTTYWLTPRNKLQFEFRHLKVSREFITNGGTQADAAIRGDFWVRQNFSLSGAVQYETWNFPVLAPGKQTDVTTSVTLAFWPKGLWRKKTSK
ncbi:MAG: capsule assembly Wzi family protein, partial [Bryobacteraceae bacterium]